LTLFHTSKGAVCYKSRFTIKADANSRLDSPFVVFDGDAHEAEPVELSGTLHLSNPDHMNVRSIKIKLEGKWKVSWLVEPTVSSLTIRDKGIIIDEELMLYPTEGQSGTVTHKIAPGCHEWRFKFLLDPFIPESVEGLAGSFVVYDLKAEIDRGYMSKNLLADKHVRVIRALGRDMTETVPMPYVCSPTPFDSYVRPLTESAEQRRHLERQAVVPHLRPYALLHLRHCHHRRIHALPLAEGHPDW